MGNVREAREGSFANSMHYSASFTTAKLRPTEHVSDSTAPVSCVATCTPLFGDRIIPCM